MDNYYGCNTVYFIFIVYYYNFLCTILKTYQLSSENYLLGTELKSGNWKKTMYRKIPNLDSSFDKIYTTE